MTASPQRVSFSSIEHTINPDTFTSSEEYAARFAGAVGEWFLAEQARIVTGLLTRPDDAPLSILELGGGHCQLTPTLVKLGHTVTVHGSDQISLQLSNSRFSDPRVNYVLAPVDGLSRSIANSSYDIVIAVRLIPHVVDWRRLLGQMAQIATKQIIFDFASSRSINFLSPLVFQFKRQVEGNTRPYFCHSSGEIRQELVKLGLPICREQGQFVWPMGLHRVLGKATKSVIPSRVLESAADVLRLRTSFGSPVLVSARRI